jgi:hypothetical protein
VLLRGVLELVVVLRGLDDMVRELLGWRRLADVVVLHHVRLLRGHRMVLSKVLRMHARGAFGGHLVDGRVGLQLAARVLHWGCLLGHVGAAHGRRVGSVTASVVHHEGSGAILGSLTGLGAVVTGGPDVQPVVRWETGIWHSWWRLPRRRWSAIVVGDALTKARVARWVSVDLRTLVSGRRVVVGRTVPQVGDVRVGEVGTHPRWHH